MGLAIEYKDMCTVKELKEPSLKQAEIEYNKDFINTKDTLNYLDSRIKECINIIAETQRDLKDEEDKGIIYALKFEAQEEINKLNILLNVEEKLKGRV